MNIELENEIHEDYSLSKPMNPSNLSFGLTQDNTPCILFFYLCIAEKKQKKEVIHHITSRDVLTYILFYTIVRVHPILLREHQAII